MTCRVLIPIKTLSQCKTRLAGALGDARRRALVEVMLRNVTDAARAARNVDGVMLIGPDEFGLGLPALPDPGAGLNAALRAGAAAQPAEASRLIILAGDLPFVAQAEIEGLAGLAPDMAAIAPDRAGAGTNALSLPLPAAAGFAFQFGEGSFAAHCKEIARLGLGLEIVRAHGLALDVDEPADLDAVSALITARETNQDNPRSVSL